MRGKLQRSTEAEEQRLGTCSLLCCPKCSAVLQAWLKLTLAAVAEPSCRTARGKLPKLLVSSLSSSKTHKSKATIGVAAVATGTFSTYASARTEEILGGDVTPPIGNADVAGSNGGLPRRPGALDDELRLRDSL